MAKTRGLAQKQLRALDRLKSVEGTERFYLAGASAIAWHLKHRRSLDLDLFSNGETDLEPIQRAASRAPGIEVVSRTDVTLELTVEDVPVDLVSYPHAPLNPLEAGPRGIPVASLEDLAAMKLAAIARRGIKRDFWDLYEICRAGMPLAQAARTYVARFGRSESDLYHVQRALTWFEDAERDPVTPVGMTPALWRRIRRFFESEAPGLLSEDATQG